MNDGPGILSTPAEGKIYSFDITDSKANLYVDTEPVICYGEGFKVCEHNVVEDLANDVVLYYTEAVGSSGLPEVVGAVY